VTFYEVQTLLEPLLHISRDQDPQHPGSTPLTGRHTLAPVNRTSPISHWAATLPLALTGPAANAANAAAAAAAAHFPIPFGIGG